MRELHPIIRDEIYRIAGEALCNAFRHAQAQQIEVEIHYGDRQFRLRVRDDGKGFDPAVLAKGGREGHHGLPGMRERAKIAGGELTVWIVNPGTGPIRILTVDDHPLVRKGIAGLISVQADMTLIGEAGNGREAIQQFRTHHPDVTLMDVQMPDMNGIDALIAIRNEFRDARIVVLTTYSGDVQVMLALKAVAQGYLLKNTLHKELLETIRAIYAGKEDALPGGQLAKLPSTAPTTL